MSVPWINPAGQDAIDEAIAAYNANPNRPFDDIGGVRSYHRARRPILATDCDYEVTSFSGVQGKNVESQS